MSHEPGDRPVFPPEVVVQVKALACELPAQTHLPLSRFSRQDLAREVVARGIVAKISGATIWRWLDQDALRPWQHRSWIFPRDPQFEPKAGRVLDLYQGYWQDQPLGSDEYVISADEKTSIQARVRIHPTQPAKPGQALRVEFEYEPGGALAYLAAWDVRRAKIFGSCDPTTGIVPFDGLVHQVMRQEPYRQPNGSSGSWTMALRTEGRLPASDCSRNTPTWCWFICRFTPVGLIRSKSTFQSCSEKC